MNPLDAGLPRFMRCNHCGAKRKLRRAEVFEVESGVAAVARSKCPRCKAVSSHFTGDPEAVSELMERFRKFEAEHGRHPLHEEVGGP